MLDDDFIRIGIVSGVHGIAGRLKVLVTTAFLHRYDKGSHIYLKKDNDYKTYRVDSFSLHKGNTALLLLDGVSTRNDAELLKGREIFITRSEASAVRENLAEDEFLHADLIGASVYHNGVHFAVVDEILDAGGNSVLLLKTDDNKQYMIPFVESMVDLTRLKDGIIDITPIEGLFDL